MSVIFRKLTEVHTPSFESAVAECDDEIEQHPLEQSIAEIHSAHHDIVASSNASNAIEELVRGTVDTYKDTGMDEQAVELYRVSVESILLMSGIDIPADTLVPSFESGKSRVQYSAEAEEKAKGILARIWEYIVNAFRRFGDMLRRLKDRIFKRNKAIEKKAEVLEEKLSKKQEEAAAKEEDKGPRKINLAEHYRKEAAALGGEFTPASYLKFRNDVDNAVSKIGEVNTAVSGTEFAANVANKTKVVDSSLGAVNGISVGKAHKLSVTFGKDAEFKSIASKGLLEFVGTGLESVDAIGLREGLALTAEVKKATASEDKLINELIDQLDAQSARFENLKDSTPTDEATADIRSYCTNAVGAVSSAMVLLNDIYALSGSVSLTCLMIVTSSALLA